MAYGCGVGSVVAKWERGKTVVAKWERGLRWVVDGVGGMDAGWLVLALRV